MASSQRTSGFFLYRAEYPKKDAFLNGMFTVNFKNMDDIKQVQKFTDHNHQDFWNSRLALRLNQQREIVE